MDNSSQHDSERAVLPAFDRSLALAQVVTDIQSALSLAREALESYGTAPHTVSRLESYLHHVGQVLGVARMLQLGGITLLAEDILGAAKSIAANQDGFSGEDYEVLVRAELTLETYITQTARGEAPSPLVMLPLLNDLRAVQQAPMLSELALFAPDLTRIPTNTHKGKHNAQTMARRLRPYYQSGLLRWYNDPGDDRGLLQLTTIIHRMERASHGRAAHQVWWIARGLIDAVLNQTIALSAAIRVLFGKLDRILKAIRDSGEDALELNPPRDVMKNMLYYIATSPAVSVRVQDIKRQYDLEHLVPDAELMQRALTDLGGPLQGLPESISNAMKEELARVKMLLDSFTYGERHDAGLVDEAIDILKSGADTLTLLGLTGIQSEIASVIQTLHSIRESEQSPDEAAMLLIAEKLLKVDSVLNNLREHLLAQPEYALSKTTVGSTGGNNAVNTSDFGPMPGAELRKAREAAFKQCLGNFTTIKQRILAYVGEPTTHNFPTVVPQMLRDVEGCLVLLETSDGAQLVGNLARHIEHKIIESQVTPQGEFLDVLAEAVMSFELFLEALANDRGDRATAYELARDSEAAIHRTASFRPTVVQAAEPPARSAVLRAVPKETAVEPEIPVADPAVAELEEQDVESSIEAIDDEVVEIFFDEAHEHVSVMREALRALNAGRPVAELLPFMQRLCHTLKGSASIVHASQVGEIATTGEQLLAALVTDSLAFNDSTAAVVSIIPDILQSTLTAFKEHQAMPSVAREFLQQVHRLLHAPVVFNNVTPASSAGSAGRTLASDLLTSFVVEVGASLANIRRFIDDCSALPGGCLVADSLLHTVKSITSNAATLDLAEIARLSSLLEHFLGRLKDAHVPADGQTLRLLTEFCETVDLLVVGLRSQTNRPVDTKDLQRSLEQVPAAVSQAPQPRTVPIDSPEDKQTLLDIFLDESQNLLEDIERAATLLDDERRRSEGIAELLRTIHTMKGSARVAGIKPVGDLAHAMESLLEAVSSNRVPYAPALRAGLTKGLDTLANMVAETRRGDIPLSDSRLLVTLSVLQTGARPEKSSAANEALMAAEAPPEIKPAVVDYAFDTHASLADTALNEDAQKKAEPLRVNADDMDKLVNCAGEGGVLLSKMDAQMSAFKNLVNEFDRLLQKLRDQTRAVETFNESSAAIRAAQTPAAGAPDLQKFTEQQQLAGELAGSVGEMMSLQGNFIKLFHDANSTVIQQLKVQRDLHEGLLSARMVPFGRQAARLQRLVRQTSEELGKDARLELVGVEGKLDRVLLDRLMGPLEHILRNALAHGIENTAGRKAAGKPEQGSVVVQLRKDGQKNVLEIEDDGAGIDLLAVRGKALEKGLVRPDQVLSHEELIHLILEPGFSTAKSVTQISGRGVGLDAANREILQMGGSLYVESRAGLGTKFTIVLPFTMAMHKVAMLRLGEQIYALPMSQVDHIEKGIEGAVLERLEQGKNPTYAHNGVAYHFWRLSDLLSETPARRAGARDQSLILVHQGVYRAALLVDEVLGEREIFVKPAALQLQNNPFIAGVTVLGDGRVALILDVGRLFRLSPARADQDAGGDNSTQDFSDDSLKVLVVDDSVTVRKVTERFLARHQMHVSTAKDGIEALQRLEERHPDIVLLDIEMPRMDGFEFTKRVRDDQRWRQLPIIMISSRGSPKHISYAEELGVNLFLGKPYQENELLDHIYRLTTHAHADVH